MKYLPKLLLCIFSCSSLLCNIYAGPENIEVFRSLYTHCLPAIRYAAEKQDVERIIPTFIRPMLTQVALMTVPERNSIASDIESLKRTIANAHSLSSENQRALMAAVTTPVGDEEIETAQSSLKSEAPVRTPTADPAKAALAKRRDHCDQIRHQTEKLKAFIARHVERCEREVREIQEQHAHIISAGFGDSHTMLTIIERSIGQSMDLLGRYLASYDQRQALIVKARHLIAIIEEHMRDDDFEVFISNVIQEVRDLVEPLFIDSRLIAEVLSCLEALQIIVLDWAEYMATAHVIDIRVLGDVRKNMHRCIDGLLSSLSVVIMGTDRRLATGQPSPVPAFAWNLFKRFIENSQVLITAIVYDSTVSDPIVKDRFLIEEAIPCLHRLMAQSFERLESWQRAGETSGDVRVTSGLFETFVNFYVTTTGALVSHFIQHTPWGVVSPEYYSMYTCGLFNGLQNLLETLHRHAHNPFIGQLTSTVKLPAIANGHLRVLCQMHDLDMQVLYRPEASISGFCHWIQNSHITDALRTCSIVYPIKLRTTIDEINRRLSQQEETVRAGGIDTIERLVLATIILLRNIRNHITDTLGRLHDKFNGRHFNILETRDQLGGQSPDEVIRPFSSLLYDCGFDFTLDFAMDTSRDEDLARQLQAEPYSPDR